MCIFVVTCYTSKLGILLCFPYCQAGWEKILSMYFSCFSLFFYLQEPELEYYHTDLHPQPAAPRHVRCVSLSQCLSSSLQKSWSTKYYKTHSQKKQTTSLSATQQPELLTWSQSELRNPNPSFSSPPWGRPAPLWPKSRRPFPWSWCHQHATRKSNEELSTVTVPCEHGFAPAPALLLMSLTRLTMILQKLWEPLAVQHLSNTSKVSKVWHKRCYPCTLKTNALRVLCHGRKRYPRQCGLKSMACANGRCISCTLTSGEKNQHLPQYAKSAMFAQAKPVKKRAFTPIYTGWKTFGGTSLRQPKSNKNCTVPLICKEAETNNCSTPFPETWSHRPPSPGTRPWLLPRQCHCAPNSRSSEFGWLSTLRQRPVHKTNGKPCQMWELTRRSAHTSIKPCPPAKTFWSQDHESKSRWISAKTRYCLILVLHGKFL